MTDAAFSAFTLEQLVDPKQAALVIVDMQKDFCHSDGASGRSGPDCTASGNNEAHDATLYNMRTHFGVVVDSQEFVAAWRNSSALTG